MSDSRLTSAQVRERVRHPVIDADGHIQEIMPAVYPFLREALGAPLFDRYVAEYGPGRAMAGVSPLDREASRIPQGAWWGTPTGSRDLATCMLPGLLHDRADELGIDFFVLFPTKAMGIGGVPDADLRRGLCRGFNEYYAATYTPFSDRLTVAGIIPMTTPDEAVDELRHCHDLGLKVVTMPEGVWRPIPSPNRDLDPWPYMSPNQTHWFDTFGMDSLYDYDTVWKTCQDLRLAVGCHAGFGDFLSKPSASISSYSYNHIGSHATRMQALCKSLFLSGVTARHPDLNIAFLECGIAWACALISDSVKHWERRNLLSLNAHLNPVNLDWRSVEEYSRHYGLPLIPSDVERGEALRTVPAIGVPPHDLDEWRPLNVADEEELVELFVPRFFFGCEADDRTLAFAFSKANVLGRSLQPLLSSDIGHWDVIDMQRVVADAYHLVDDGLMSDSDFRRLTFDNPVSWLTGADPGFFDGTLIEAPLSAEIASRPGMR